MIANGSIENQEEFWLFGYGSLIWKPPPHYGNEHSHLSQRGVNLEGVQTRGFLVTSQDMCGAFGRFVVEVGIRCKLIDNLGKDHRGTAEAPGRVATLIERSFWKTLNDPHMSGSDRVWGTAYRIEGSKVAGVREYLDIREINGYTIHYTPFHPADGSPTIKTLVYIGTPDNDQFTGPQDPQELAEHIYRSIGPSGLNKDYLLSLDQALDELSPESGDSHIKDLSERVKAIETKNRGIKTRELTSEATGAELKRLSRSTDEQEEVEK